jgi:hypothetical protein
MTKLSKWLNTETDRFGQTERPGRPVDEPEWIGWPHPHVGQPRPRVGHLPWSGSQKRQTRPYIYDWIKVPPIEINAIVFQVISVVHVYDLYSVIHVCSLINVCEHIYSAIRVIFY